MFNISSFLEKISHTLSKTDIQRDDVLKTIQNITYIEINPESLEIKNNIIYIKSSPAIKNKLFISKNKIISEIQRLYNVSINDIR